MRDRRRWAFVCMLAVCCTPLVQALPADGDPGAAGSSAHAGLSHESATRRQAAGSVHVSGTIRYVQPTNPDHPDGASAQWAVDGDALLLLDEAPLVGITNTTGLSNSDERYAHALLSSVAAVVPPVPCGDGTDATSTVEYTGISDPSAAIALSTMQVNQYDGKGSVHVNIAESPTRDYDMWAPGTVSVHQHSDCYGSPTDATSNVPVMGEASGLEPLGGYWAFQDTFMGRWRLKRGTSGAWEVHQHRDLSTTSYDSSNETIDLVITGPLTTLKADCALPTIRRLSPAGTFSAADAIVRKGGFSHFRNVAKPSRAAPRGHFFVLEGVGNKYASCGQRHLRVVKSLGWPS